MINLSGGVRKFAARCPSGFRLGAECQGGRYAVVRLAMTSVTARTVAAWVGWWLAGEGEGAEGGGELVSEAGGVGREWLARSCGGRRCRSDAGRYVWADEGGLSDQAPFGAGRR